MNKAVSDMVHAGDNADQDDVRFVIITSQAYSLINFRAPLIRLLIERGVTVYALAPDYTAATRRGIETLGAIAVDISLSRATIHPWADVRDLWRLIRCLRRIQPHHVLTYLIKPVIYGSIAARLAGVKHRHAMIEGAGFVFGRDPQAQHWRRKLLRGLVRMMYRVALWQSKSVFFLNDNDYDEFVRGCGLNPQRAHMLGPIGVDLVRFSATVPSLAPMTFILIGRLLIEKGVAVYVDAARIVRRTAPQVRVLLLGSPDVNPHSLSAEQLQAWAAEGVVEWHAHVADVRPWLQQADVVVLPSWYREGAPRSLQEGLAMGRAVITTDLPGCRELVLPGQTGLLVPPQDSAALAAAMLSLIDAPQRVVQMGRQARAYAEQHLDECHMNRQWVELMFRAVSELPSPSEPKQ